MEWRVRKLILKNNFKIVYAIFQRRETARQRFVTGLGVCAVQAGEWAAAANLPGKSRRSAAFEDQKRDCEFNELAWSAALA
jgi:hypothetical protein